MLNRKQIKEVLLGTITNDVVNDFKEREQNLPIFLFKHFNKSEYDNTDKKALKLIIEAHVQSLSEKEKDIFKESETLDDLSRQLETMAKDRNKGIRGAFDNSLNQKRLDRLSDEISALSLERNNILMKYISNSKGLSGADTLRFHLDNVTRVRYDEDEDYMVDKSSYEIAEKNSFDTLSPHIHEDAKIEPIRIIDDYKIAIDFEDIGYLILTSHPTSEYEDIIKNEEKSASLRLQWDKMVDEGQHSRNISFILEKACEELDSYYGEGFSKLVVENGEEIAILLSKYAESSDEQAILNIRDILSHDENSKLLERDFTDHLSERFQSKESISSFAMEIRRSMMNSKVDFDEIERKFNENVENAISLRESGDEIGYRRALNNLNIFEKMYVDIDYANKSSKSKGKDFENDNVSSNSI